MDNGAHEAAVIHEATVRRWFERCDPCLRGFLQQVHHQPVSCADRRKADRLGCIRAHKLLDSLRRAQVRPRQFAAVDGLHLGLEAATKLLRHRQSAERFLHGVTPFLLEADSHHGTGDGTADGPRIADPAGEAGGDPGNDFVLNPEFLAHGQQYGLRSSITLLHDFRGPVLFHFSFSLFWFSCMVTSYLFRIYFQPSASSFLANRIFLLLML